MGGVELYFVQIIWLYMKESFVNYKGNEDPKVLDDPKISEEIMDFYDPKVFGDTFIFDGLVYLFSVFSKSLNGSSFRNSVKIGTLPSCLPALNRNSRRVWAQDKMIF